MATELYEVEYDQGTILVRADSLTPIVNAMKKKCNAKRAKGYEDCIYFTIYHYNARENLTVGEEYSYGKYLDGTHKWSKDGRSYSEGNMLEYAYHPKFQKDIVTPSQIERLK